MGSSTLRPFALRALALLLGALASVLLLLLVELGVRVLAPRTDALPLWLPLDPERQPDADEMLANQVERTQLHEPDRQLFWRNRPGVDVTLRGARVRTNSLGLRDDELPAVKGADEYRILVLGESTAFGDEVEQHEVFGEVLERALGRRASRCRVSVINAAVTGYSLFQSYKYLELRGLALEPDLVLIYHGYNDFLPTTYVTRRWASPGAPAGRTDRELFAERARLPGRLDLLLFQQSAAYRWLRGAVPGDAKGRPRHRRSTVRRVPEQDRREILAALRGLADERDVGLVILVPVYRAFARHRQVLLDFAARTGTPAIDLLDTVPARPRDRVALFRKDGVHPTPALHARFAERIGAALLAPGTAPGLAACLGPHST